MLSEQVFFDQTALKDLTEPAILEKLNERFKQDMPYTSMDYTIVIAVRVDVGGDALARVNLVKCHISQV